MFPLTQACGKETLFYIPVEIPFPKKFWVSCELLYEVKWEKRDGP